MVNKILSTIITAPQDWKVVFQDRDSIVFACGDYRFTRLSDRFNCIMLLNSKNNTVKASWQATDMVAIEVYNKLIYTHLR